MTDVEELADRLAIQDLLTRYAVAVDVGPLELLDTVFTPDARIDYTSAGGIAGSFAEVTAWLAQVLPLLEVKQHFVANTAVVFAPGRNEATATSYLDNPMGIRDASGAIRMFRVSGYYHDHLVRTPDGWRIASRREEIVSRVGDVPATP